MLVCGTNPDQLHCLCSLFLCFEAVFGLDVILAELVLVDQVTNVDGLVGILRCKELSLPKKYLGILFGFTFKAQEIWNESIKKIDYQLAG